MSLLLQRLLHSQGILMDEAGADGGAGGGGAPAGAEGGEGGAGEGGDAGKGEGGEKASGANAGEGDGDGGEKKPSEAEAKLLKEVMKWKAKAKEAGTNSDDAKSSLQKITDALGETSVEDVQALIQAQKDAATAELESKGEYDRIVEQIKDENKKVVGGLQEQIDALTQQLSGSNGQIEEMTVGRSFGESGFIRENSTLPSSIARKEFGKHFDVVDGQVKAFDKPRGAEGRTPLVDAEGNGKRFEVAIEQLYKGHADAASLIKSKAKPGAGSKTDSQIKAKASEPELKGVSRITAGLNAQSK